MLSIHAEVPIAVATKCKNRCYTRNLTVFFNDNTTLGRRKSITISFRNLIVVKLLNIGYRNFVNSSKGIFVCIYIHTLLQPICLDNYFNKKKIIVFRCDYLTYLYVHNIFSTILSIIYFNNTNIGFIYA